VILTFMAFGAAGGILPSVDTDIFTDQPYIPPEITMISKVDCSSDIAEIEFVARSNGNFGLGRSKGDYELKSIKINNNLTPQVEIDRLNKVIVKKLVKHVAWVSCPRKPEDSHPFTAYIEFKTTTKEPSFHFMPLTIYRDGTVSRSLSKK